MPRKKTNSRALRQLAEDFLQRIPEPELSDDREELVTSLVRQWITYDGSAVLFVGDQQLYLPLGKTPLGKPIILPEPVPPGWLEFLIRDWKVSPADLPDMIGQLNRGQSAEVINDDDIPLRIWVNPRERCRGVESLVQKKASQATAPDYSGIAAQELEQSFGEALAPEEFGKLTSSVAKQWQQHDGYACLFLDCRRQLTLKLIDHKDGTCDVEKQVRGVDVEPVLASLGFPLDAIPEIIARINLGEKIEFQDRTGFPSRLCHDPKTRVLTACRAKVEMQCLDIMQPTTAVVAPILCPLCTAVLTPWSEGQRQQSCPLCGNTVSIP